MEGKGGRGGVVSWEGEKGGKILRWQDQRGGRVVRWQVGKGEKVVRGQGGKVGRVVRWKGGKGGGLSVSPRLYLSVSDINHRNEGAGCVQDKVEVNIRVVETY